MALKEIMAVVLAVGGSLATTSYQYGSLNNKVNTQATQIAAQQAKLDAIEADKALQFQHNGKVEEALEDIKKHLDRIDSKL